MRLKPSIFSMSDWLRKAFLTKRNIVIDDESCNNHPNTSDVTFSTSRTKINNPLFPVNQAMPPIISTRELYIYCWPSEHSLLYADFSLGTKWLEARAGDTSSQIENGRVWCRASKINIKFSRSRQNSQNDLNIDLSRWQNDPKLVLLFSQLLTQFHQQNLFLFKLALRDNETFNQLVIFMWTLFYCVSLPNKPARDVCKYAKIYH